MYPQCPHCGTNHVRRSQRLGALERVLSVARVYPFRCQVCSRRFRTLEWGTPYGRELIDQREYERIPVRLAVSFYGDRMKGQGRLIELSMGGCSFQTEDRLRPGELLQLSFQPSEQEAHIHVEAVVIRSVRPPMVGVEFLRLQSAQEDSLRQFVSRRAAELTRR